LTAITFTKETYMGMRITGIPRNLRDVRGDGS